MQDARPQHAALLSFVQIQDFENPGGFEEAVQGIDAVIHVASVRCTRHTRSMLYGRAEADDLPIAIYLRDEE